MKRFLVGCVIAVALTGCANSSEGAVDNTAISVDNTTMAVEKVVSISESNDVSKESGETAKESSEAVKNSFHSGNEKVDKMAMEEVILDQNEIIKSSGWTNEERLYRVEIDYVDTPKDEYTHKRDEFFYVYEDGRVTSFEAKYTTKFPTEDYHQTFAACGFETVLADVNFDGVEDVVISLGHAGAQGALVHTVYLGSEEGFTANKSFEDISNFQLDSKEQLIHGNYRSNAETRVEQSYEYDEVTNSFVLLEEIVIDNATESLFSTVGNALYEKSADLQNYIIVSRYGENYDGAELIGDKCMLTDELEYFFSEVMGENRSFTSGQAHSNELAVECRNDGYCYTYNGGVGTMGYFGVKNIIVNRNMCHVEVGYYDDLDNEMDSISFNMKKADNKYGYTLVSLEDKQDDFLTDGDLQSVDAQIALIESKYNECVSGFEMEAVCQKPVFAITDFNQNGRLELVLTDTNGSGAFSVSTFYEVSEDYKSLNQMKVEGNQYYDICGDFQSYEYFDCYKKNGSYYYVVEDYSSSGWDCKGTTFYLYSFDAGVNKTKVGGYVVLGTMDEQNNATYHVRLYNSENKLCQSVDEYNSDIDSFLDGFEKVSFNAVKWMSLYDKQPIGERLYESYKGYNTEANESNVHYYSALWGENANYVFDVE